MVGELLPPDALFADEEEAEDRATGDDPWEPFNRAMFAFHDFVYLDVAKPVAEVYKFVLPSPTDGDQELLPHLATPVRLLSYLLQGRLEQAGTELGRFAINSTLGFAGLADPAAEAFGIAPPPEADTGLALGSWGIAEGPFLVLPILGPSTLRDTLGLPVDYLINPSWWIEPFELAVAVGAFRYLNDATFRLDDYQAMTEAAVDPYVALRGFYLNYRRQLLKDDTRPGPRPAAPALVSSLGFVGPAR